MQHTLAVCIVIASVYGWSCRAQSLNLKWHNRPLPGDFNLHACAYGKGAFVVLASRPAPSWSEQFVLTSPNGVDWQARPETNYLGALSFGGGFFWALNTAGLLRSTNGIEWELAWPRSLGGGGPISATEGQIIAVVEPRATPGCGILTSLNAGATWNYFQTNGFPLAAATAGNGLFIAALVDPASSKTRFHTSPDGNSWTSAFQPFGAVKSLSFVNGLFVGITAASSSGTPLEPQLITSVDGTNWNSARLAADLSPMMFGHGNGVFAVLGYKYDPSSGNTLYVGSFSTNLTQWHPSATTNFTSWRGLCYGAGTFLALSETNILQSDVLTRSSPVVTLQPKGTGVYEGGTARFSVAAFGTDPISYQWRHNQQPLPGQTNTSLVISHAQVADAGEYDVVISNEAGVTTSQPAWLAVSWLSIARYAGLTLLGEVGSAVTIEYAESVNNTNWLVLTNLILPSSPYTWIDYDSPNHPFRFYRGVRK